MKHQTLIKTFVVLVLGAAVLSGCMIQFGGSKSAGVAGVFKSFDKGANWTPKNLFLYSGGTGSIAGMNVLSLTFDPQDNRAIYLASDVNGLLYTYDAAESWMKADQVGNGKISSAVIDPKNKCVIYATFANTILKSIDCNRSWKEIYIDSRVDKVLTALAVDFYNSLIIYAGNSAGDLLLSTDGGDNWQVINRLGDRAMKIMIAPNDNRIIYVATKGKGIYKSVDAGKTWNDINADLKDYAGAMEYKNLIFDLSQQNSIMLISKYGLIKSADGGATWLPIKLITPPSSVDIYATAINPKNSNEIYYATATTFYKTVDGGKNWVTTRLPSSAAATYLVIDPINPNILYMGFSNLSK